MNEGWSILDFQPWTGNASYQPTNGFPVDAQVTVRLKAYVYDKTSTVQDLVEDAEPLNITVVDTIYGKNFLESGQFKTDAEGFPADYVFQMPSSKYQLTYELLNAVSHSGRDVTVIDSTGIRYIFQGEEVDPVEQDQWAK